MLKKKKFIEIFIKLLCTYAYARVLPVRVTFLFSRHIYASSYFCVHYIVVEKKKSKKSCCFHATKNVLSLTLTSVTIHTFTISDFERNAIKSY